MRDHVWAAAFVRFSEELIKQQYPADLIPEYASKSADVIVALYEQAKAKGFTK